MREKILKLISLTTKTVDDIVEGMVSNHEHQYRDKFGDQIPPDQTDGLQYLTGTLKGDRDTLENRIVEVYSQHLTEEEIDAAIEFEQRMRDAVQAFKESPAGQRLTIAARLIESGIIEATDVWLKDNFKVMEPELLRILGQGAPPAAPTLEDARQ
jgi:hypothetical protein